MSDYKTGLVDFSSFSSADLSEMFALFDTVGDGKIYVRHVGDALRALGQNPTESFINKLTADHNPDDRLSVDEFTPILNVAEKQKSKYSPEDIVEGNGFMQTSELKRILLSIGEKLSDEDAQLVLEGFENSHGNVNYEEFVRQVVSG